MKTEFWVELIKQQIPLGPEVDLLQLGGAWDACFTLSVNKFWSDNKLAWTRFSSLVIEQVEEIMDCPLWCNTLFQVEDQPVFRKYGIKLELKR